MGLGNSSNATFLTISNGKLCKQSSHATASSIERVNKNGKTVHEEFYDHISGTITDIKVKDHPDYGKNWEVTINDNGVDYKLQFNYSSGYANGFLKVLPNMVMNEEVTIIPNLKMEGDKKKTTMFVRQNGEVLKHAFTKDHPNGLPQLKKIKVKGKETWDDSEVMEFLEHMVMVEILPKIGKKNYEPATASQSESDDNAPF